jgi:three-Cys-motif partner protein
MATGTSAGLPDSSEHAQSIFKHAIIRHHMPPFLAMTGSTSQNRRAVVMDGFAGRGRYPDGTPASAELIMRAVRGLQGTRTVATFFVENDRRQYRALDAVVSEYAAQGLEAEALPGSADDHLDAVIEAARGIPLFLFLDPCGALLPFRRLARMVGGARRGARPATESLLNFSADFTRPSGRAARCGPHRRIGHRALGYHTWWPLVVACGRDGGLAHVSRRGCSPPTATVCHYPEPARCELPPRNHIQILRTGRALPANRSL